MDVFWDLNGSPHGWDDNGEGFVRYYEKFYYNDCPLSINGVSQSSRYVEEQIEEILKTGITETSDVSRILAWKMGKINHRKSKGNEQFVYYSGWESAENPVRKFRINGLDLKPLMEYVLERSKSVNEWTDKDAADTLNKMKEKVPQGIGSVYMIALLYFMSNGKYPIFDQYADRAVKALIEGTKPGTCIKSKELPDKTYKDLGKKLLDPSGYYIGTYKTNIAKIFGSYDSYRKNRKFDRALWVYGHLFAEPFCSAYGDWFKSE